MRTFCMLITLLWLLPSTSKSQWQSNDNDDNPDAENLEESGIEDDTEKDNDYHLQQLQYYRKHPVDINSSEVEDLSLLSPLQLTQLGNYHKLLGDLIDVYELQAIPGFTINLIRQLLPYVCISRNPLSVQGIKQMLTGGQHTFLARFSITPEKSVGFKSGRFAGTRIANFYRYRYQYRNLLQFGMLAEKDAGEKMLAPSGLPEFLSFHFFLKNRGVVKAFAAGDYVVNVGQGLICWQGQAFSKGAEVINIKRESETIRPYHSAGEFNFNRGFAITLGKSNTDLTFYVSKRKLSSNISTEGTVTSVQTSGFHRTAAELEDRNNLTLDVLGASLKRRLPNGYFRINTNNSRYSLPLQKRNEPYNLYTLKGKIFGYASIDYGFTMNNFHLFGEIAVDKSFKHAIVNGVIASLGKTVDLSIHHRYINKHYQALYGNAFSEVTVPSDEQGIYMGVRASPNDKWRLDMYVDLYRFKWLKYRVDAPSWGSACYIQATYQPTRRLEFYTRFRFRNKPLDYSGDPDSEGLGEAELTDFPLLHNIYNWRTNIALQASREWTLRMRMEVCGFEAENTGKPETGYMFYSEVLFKPWSFWLSGNARVALFETSSYNTRIYAYEPDVLFVSSIPPLYNSGVRYSLNLKGRFLVNRLNNRQLAVQIKAASTVYANLSQVGSGDNTIPGNRNSMLKLQFFLTY